MDKPILNVLISHEVSPEHIAYLKEKFKSKFFTVEDCDRELIKMGYEPVFVVDLDEEDDDFDYSDNYEKRASRKHFDD